MAKKLPLHIRDLDKERRDKIGWIQDRWVKHPFVEFFFGHWEEWIAWFEGDQYKYYNKSLNSLVDIADLVDREIKNVYNRIMPMIRQQWGELRYPHEFFVIPNTSEMEDVRASRTGSRMIEFTNDERKFNKKINRSKLWALICGICYWKEFWNKDLFGLIPKPGGKGNNRVPGDIDYDYVNPFNCRPDPTSLERENWRYFIEGKRVPTASVEDEFGLPRGTIPGEGPIKDKSRTGVFERDDYNFGDEPTCIRTEYYETPKFEGRDDGRMIVCADDWMFYDDENPNPDAQIGYFIVPGLIPKLNSPIYDSAVRILQPTQRQFNRNCSQVDEHVKNWKIKGMIPWGSLLPGEKEAFTRAGVDYVTYNARMGTPYYQSPPPLPEFLGFWINWLDNEIETEGSVRKVSLGALPKYASRASGVLFEGLKRQDEIVLVPAVEELDDNLVQAMKFRLELIQGKYSEERLVKTIGKHRTASVSYFKGADLRDNTDVRIRPGVDVIMTQKRKEEVVMALVNKGMIDEPRKALELMGYKTQEEFIEDEFIDERFASRQLEIMKDGKIYITSNPNDNHEIMYLTFNNARKSEDFESLPEKARENILKRIEEEKEYVAGGGEGAGAPAAEAAAAPGATPAGRPIPGEGGAIALPEMAATPANPPATQEEILQAIIAQGGL